MFEKLFGSGKGLDCTQNQDGTQTCTVFQKDGDQLKASGSTVNMMVNPNDCSISLVGHNRILDEDEEVIKEGMERAKKGCQRGIA